LEQQLEDQTSGDDEEIRAKIKKMQMKKLPDFVKRNEKAGEMLKKYEDIVEKYEELVKGKSKEEIHKEYVIGRNKNLIEQYERRNIAGNILKKQNEFHCFYEIRERAQREKEGKPPTDWEVLEFLL
jgi:hypothetical protein